MTRAEAIAELWQTAQVAIHEHAVGDAEEREWEQETHDALLALGCTEDEARSGAYRLPRPRPRA